MQTAEEGHLTVRIGILTHEGEPEPRRDVTVVTLPLLPAKWYRAELARRYRLLDSNAVDNWLGRDSTVKLITKRSYDQNRPVIRSPFFALDSTAKN